MNTVTLISGATSGMGKRTAFYLAGRGYRVFAGFRDDAAGVSLTREAQAQGLVIDPVQLDVTDTASVDRATRHVFRQAGRIDALVNNAGFGLVSTVENATDEETLRQFDVNVFGIFRMCRSVLPIMRDQRDGVIVNVSSFLGRMGLPLLTHYNASKYAVEAITDSMRHEVRSFGIRVHSVMPGLFGTEFASRGLSVNTATMAETSPYHELVCKMVPMVAEKINKGPDPLAVAEAVEQVIRVAGSPIRVPVGQEAITFVPMAKSMTEDQFESKIQEIFGF